MTARRRNILAGLATPMREAIALLAGDGKLTLSGGDYWTANSLAYAQAPTLAALALRGLAVQRFDPKTGRAFYRPTPRGRRVAAKLARIERARAAAADKRQAERAAAELARRVAIGRVASPTVAAEFTRLAASLATPAPSLPE